jgi:hypothetical protein
MRNAWDYIKGAAAACAALWLSRSTRITVSALSPEWLRSHEIDAGKHDAS